MALTKYSEGLKRCRCDFGLNKGQLYVCSNPCDFNEFFSEFLCDCFPDEPPCPNGVALTVTSTLTVGRSFEIVETFIPAVYGVSRGAPARVYDDSLDVWRDGEWQTLMTMPWVAGMEYEGKRIQFAIHKAVVSSVCH